MSIVIAIDQGTTSSRCIAFDPTGTAIASSQKEHRQITPSPGWLEHDADEIFENVQHCTHQVIDQVVNKMGKTIVACGITNQRETTIAWRRSTSKPLHHAVVWSDCRTESLVAELTEKFGGVDFARSTCGLPCSTYFSATKMIWLLRNSEAVQKAAEEDDLCFGTMDSFLIWKFSHGKNFVTDVTNASRTMLMSLHTRNWDPVLCRDFGIKESWLPRIASCSELFGAISRPGGMRVPITGCIGDQQGALVGQRCFEEGEAKNTYGTGCFLLVNAGTKPPVITSGLLSTVAFQLGPSAPCMFAIEGAVAGAGSAVQWLRDKMSFFEQAVECEKIAASVPDTGGVIVVPAFSGLLAPYWKPDARGTICGITQLTTRAHIVRATLESVAHQVTTVVSEIEASIGKKLPRLRVDGGMTENSLLMQMQADFLNRPVEVAAVKETTALGAAICAALAVGAWGTVHRIHETVTPPKAVFTPSMAKAARKAEKKRWQEGVRRSFGWAKL